MEPWRRTAVALVIVGALAWSAYCLFFFALLGVPSIEGGIEAMQRARQVIVLGWLSGMAVAGLVVVGLWRRTFDRTATRRRRRLAAMSWAAAALIVVGAFWFAMGGALLFAWGPLVAALLTLTAWASPPALRRRLATALIGWLAGAAAIALLWFATPAGALGFHFWTLVALVSVAAAAWWLLPLSSRARLAR